jgi:guanylate kinase
MVSQPIFIGSYSRRRESYSSKGLEVNVSMSKFSIAFIMPAKSNALRHRIIESEDQDSALKSFFSEEASEFYSNDDQGFFYFKEDFFDETNTSGSVIRLD